MKVASARGVVAVVLLNIASTVAGAGDTPAPADVPDSPRIAALAKEASGGDATASGRFWREMDGKAPLVEPIGGDAKHVRVTFVWRGTDKTRRVYLIGGLPGGDQTLDRLEGTDVCRRPCGASSP